MSVIDRLRQQRRSWIDLGGGVEVLIQRPAETRLSMMRSGITVDHAVSCVVDWRGVTEATLLGAAVGATDPLPFDADLWAEVVQDNVEWATTTIEGIAKAVTTYLEERQKARGN